MKRLDNKTLESVLSHPLQAEAEILAQIDPFHLRVAAEHVRTAGAEDLSVIDDVGPVGDDQGFADIMIGHQNPDSGPLQVRDDALQFDHLNRIDSGKWLVEQ